MTAADAQSVLLNILHAVTFNDSTKNRLANIILGNGKSEEEIARIMVNRDRSVPYSGLEKLAASPILNYAEEFIRAALDPSGPHQTREIMMIAASYLPSADFLRSGKLTKTDKTLVGYILSIAGFERKSVHNAERHMPLKAWVPMRRPDYLTVDDMVAAVLSTVGTEVTETRAPQPYRAPQPQTLSDLV
jgi:hypothetical protein